MQRAGAAFDGDMTPAHPFLKPLASYVAATCVGTAVALVTIAPNLTCPTSDFVRMDLENLRGATKIFVKQNGRLPLGLEELWRKQILDKVPRDHWDRPYRYWIVRHVPVFVSLGRDGRCGGVGDDVDIASGNFSVHPAECSAREN